jgi:hypothetical protein
MTLRRRQAAVHIPGIQGTSSPSVSVRGYRPAVAPAYDGGGGNPVPRHESDAMPPARHTTVMILYTHPLLGEGIARLLASEPGIDLEVIPVKSADAELVQRTLALAPDVVIYERGNPDRAMEILRSAPGALLIDVGIDAGPTFTYHREEIPGRPEGLLKLIRAVRPGALDPDAAQGPAEGGRPEDPATAARSARVATAAPILPTRAVAGS